MSPSETTCRCGHLFASHTNFSGCMVIGCWCHLPNPEDVRINFQKEAPSPAGSTNHANTEKPGAAQSANPSANTGGQPPAPGRSDHLTKPILIDAFCGAGGCAAGYQRAGFHVVGIDIEPQPNYCGDEFVQADAVAYLRGLLRHELFVEFDAIHASPPCQAYSDLQKQSKREYPDLIAPTRDVLRASGLPYVIENVEGAPLIEPYVLCGTMFPGLRVIRHRLFETSFPMPAPLPHPKHPLVFTHDKRKAHYGTMDQNTSFVQVTGGGNCTVANKLDAMGVYWMTGQEANEAIPPAFAEFVGRQLRAHVQQERIAA